MIHLFTGHPLSTQALSQAQSLVLKKPMPPVLHHPMNIYRYHRELAAAGGAEPDSQDSCMDSMKRTQRFFPNHVSIYRSPNQPPHTQKNRSRAGKHSSPGAPWENLGSTITPSWDQAAKGAATGISNTAPGRIYLSGPGHSPASRCNGESPGKGTGKGYKLAKIKNQVARECRIYIGWGNKKKGSANY